MVKKLQGRIASAAGGASGMGSIISAHNICHYLCLGTVAILSVFGIVVSSNLLMFLEDYKLLFWSIGILFLAISLFLYNKFGNCISTKMILFNTGLLIAGFPFNLLDQYIFWTLGGFVVASSIIWYLKEWYR